MSKNTRSWVSELLIVGLIGLSFGVFFWLRPNFAIAPSEAEPQTVQVQLNNLGPDFSGLDNFIEQSEGDFSVIVTSTDGQVLYQYRPDQAYFSASIYKLTVAYLTYVDIGEGSKSLQQTVRTGETLEACLHKMIWESDSPCGEAVLALYDRSQADQRLLDNGISGLSIEGFQINAEGVNSLLQAIWQSQDLPSELRAKLLNSMSVQKFDKGMIAGMLPYEVWDKVGFSPIDWHDVGYVFVDDEAYIVTILSENAGAEGVKAVADELRQVLEN